MPSFSFAISFLLVFNEVCWRALFCLFLISYSSDFVLITVIGAWNNTQTIIRKGKVLTDLHTTHVLMPKQPIEINIKIFKGNFWWKFDSNEYSHCFPFSPLLFGWSQTQFVSLIASVADGRINILRENKMLAETFDSNPLEIGHMSFGSFDNAIITYHYNCKNPVARTKRHNLTGTIKTTSPTPAFMMSAANSLPNNIVSLLVILSVLRILLPCFHIQFHLI